MQIARSEAHLRLHIISPQALRASIQSSCRVSRPGDITPLAPPSRASRSACGPACTDRFAILLRSRTGRHFLCRRSPLCCSPLCSRSVGSTRSCISSRRHPLSPSRTSVRGHFLWQSLSRHQPENLARSVCHVYRRADRYLFSGASKMSFVARVARSG
jgi:hypothetical protein